MPERLWSVLQAREYAYVCSPRPHLHSVLARRLELRMRDVALWGN